jgi:TolA-binding protein/thiol-disulfide isomerase/thioredoxin
VHLLASLLASASPLLGAQTPAPQPAPPQAKPPVVAPAPAAPADPATAAFDAAMDLKRKQKHVETAQAFEAFVKQFPDSPRVPEAIVEAGVGWYAAARAKMVLHRATEDSDALSAKATKIFADFLKERPKDPQAGRVQYLVGMNRFFLGDLAGAEAAFDAVMTKYPDDPKYVPLSLERRSAMRRHLFENDLAVADLQRYVRDFPKGENLEKVQKALQYSTLFDKPAPALRIEAWVQGGPLTLDKLKGKVVGLLFFATWCPHCEEERPFILELDRRYAPAGLALVGVVNHSQNQTVESVRAWLPKNEVRFPVLMDANQATAGSYHESTIPTLVLIDKSGKVRWLENPSALWDYTIETLLAEDDSAASAPKK